jgi:hypothetical protein
MDGLDAFLAGLGDVGALQEIVGYGGGRQIVGAQGAPAKGLQGLQQRLQRVMAGIPQQSIAAGASFDATVNVSEEFRPDRIILNTASWALNVTNVRIGTKSLNVTSNPLSGECFARDSVGGYLQGYTAQGGVGFVIQFTNPTAGAIVCAGGVIGPGTN